MHKQKFVACTYFTSCISSWKVWSLYHFLRLNPDLVCWWFMEKKIVKYRFHQSTQIFSLWFSFISTEKKSLFQRRVYCNEDPVDTKQPSCDSSTKPNDTRTCNSERDCGGKWFASKLALGQFASKLALEQFASKLALGQFASKLALEQFFQ